LTQTPNTKDTLFILPPGFFDNERREYCPESAEAWGLLAYYPHIKDGLDIHYVKIGKPRAPMTALLGDKNQNAPTLVLHADSPSFEDVGVMQKNGHRFINNARDMGAYWSKHYGTAWPRGH